MVIVRSYRGIATRIHESCYIDESAQIIGDVEIGENSSIWMNAVIRGDVFAIRIGANSNVQDCSVLHGMRYKYGVTMGNWVTVGHSVTLHGCTIGDRCLIGMGSVILNNRSEEHTSELQSHLNLVCRLLLEKKKSTHDA